MPRSVQYRPESWRWLVRTGEQPPGIDLTQVLVHGVGWGPEMGEHVESPSNFAK